MDEIEQQSMPFPEAQKRKRRFRRGIFLLPSLFTVANLLCGYYASIAALVGRNEDFDHAAKAIGIAILFDSMDGRIARMTGTNTEFGVQFDSSGGRGEFWNCACDSGICLGIPQRLCDPGLSPVGRIRVALLLDVSDLFRMAAGAI